jgi:hypothetical protein
MPRTEGGNAPARGHARASTRRRRAPPYHGPTWELALERGLRRLVRALRVAASARASACHTTCTRARGVVFVPAAHARRGPAPYYTLMRRGALAAKRPHPRALGYKKPPPSPPVCEPAVRCLGELTPPLATATDQGFQPLP